MIPKDINLLADLTGSSGSGKPIIVRSPGRINFIGEHTDYNEGFVLPAAIDKAIYLAVSESSGSKISFTSLDFKETVELDAQNVTAAEKHWVNYLAGTVAELQKAGCRIGSFRCAFGGDIPVGAGLSSSAAITTGLAFSLNQLFDLGIPRAQIARIAQLAEQNYAGVKCGIMDQFINLHGEVNKAIKLDCRDLTYETYPFLFPEVSVVLCDSGIRHSLASSEYNKRREQCEEGVAVIGEKYPVKSLRDVNIDILEEFSGILSPEIYSRCLYVVEENERVQQAAEYLSQSNIVGFGELLALTHEGLRNDYEVSIPEIDRLVYAALDFDGIYGSRLMGGGFGGCTINLVRKEKTAEFINRINDLFKNQAGFDLKIYECNIAPGTSIIA